jgi:integrase/recombinase XerD
MDLFEQKKGKKNAGTGNRTRAEGLEEIFIKKDLSKNKNAITIDAKVVEKYFSFREVNGLSKGWLRKLRGWIKHYLEYIDYEITEEKTLDYLKTLMKGLAVNSYRKKIYQIRKFLCFLNIDWASNIIPPAEPFYNPRRITKDEINKTLSFFKNHEYFKQIEAVILLGCCSGLRAMELYQLSSEDIDIKNRVLHINHNPSIGQSTKTKRSRVSFFNEEAQRSISTYLEYFNNGSSLKKLFSMTHLERLFSKAPIKVKDLRKYFSQEWDRRGGPTSIKKILMGHSMRHDVDLMHYNCQSEEDLKKIYDKVMNK